MCNGHRLTHAGSLDDDIVKRTGFGQIPELYGQILLQRAADASVRQGDQTVVLRSDNTAAADQLCIDIDLSDIIDDHRCTDSLLICQNMV